MKYEHKRRKKKTKEDRGKFETMKRIENRNKKRHDRWIDWPWGRSFATLPTRMELENGCDKTVNKENMELMRGGDKGIKKLHMGRKGGAKPEKRKQKEEEWNKNSRMREKEKSSMKQRGK